jgi:hypothetical protein
MTRIRKPPLGPSRSAFWKKHDPERAERLKKRANKQRQRAGDPKPTDALTHRVPGSFENGSKRR